VTTAAIPALPRPAPAEAPAKAKLWPVALPAAQAEKARSNVPFGVLVIGLLLAGMIGYLFLQTELQRQAFELNDLRIEASYLQARESYLEAGLATRTTPLELARSAAALGMVANPYGTFLDVRTGEVLGANRPVAGNEVPVMSAPVAIAEPEPEPEAEPAADALAADGAEAAAGEAGEGAAAEAGEAG
jgi:hypothetical protein